MPELALKISSENDIEPLIQIEKRIKETYTDELIIGLCGPIGTDIHFVADTIKNCIEEKYNYICIKITLSDLIKRHSSSLTLNGNEKKFNYYDKLIDAGNELRSTHGPSILAELVVNEIAVRRELERKSEDEEFKSLRICYIVDSIKNIEELHLLKLVYRDIFYFIGVFSNLEKRISYLNKKYQMDESDIYKLINRDSGEDKDFGQKVTNTFVEADFFLRVEESSTAILEPKIYRYLGLIFASEVITPTSNETAMYLASAAAGNSACLSRQVGASITNSNGDLLSVGWNDVPKAGGSVYQILQDETLAIKDYRCYNLDGGICFNDQEKNLISELLVKTLLKEKIIESSKKDKVIEIIKKSRIKELIEFSRAVHAEMLAIILAGQKAGSQIVNGKLFCTTYPCHNCARHIVAAGIKEVYYIEPYRKSLAIKLHYDAITEDESKQKLVRILMYDGVSPNRYLEFFKMNPNSRKINGKKINIRKKEVPPKITISLQAIPILEKQITQDLEAKKLINT